jgi:hypothetical protein
VKGRDWRPPISGDDHKDHLEAEHHKGWGWKREEPSHPHHLELGGGESKKGRRAGVTKGEIQLLHHLGSLKLSFAALGKNQIEPSTISCYT